MFDLDDKIALITGASGGIGGSIARVLYTMGATVVLSGTRTEKLDILASELGSKAFVVTSNLSKSKDTLNLIQKAEAIGGRLDILVNNAGATQDNIAVRMKDDEWDQVIAVNLSASFRLSRAALRGMIRRRWGRIINITSVVGIAGNAGQTNYAASKAGLVGMTKSLAKEVATRGVTVNCVAPGFIGTAMTEALNANRMSRIIENIPIV